MSNQLIAQRVIKSRRIVGIKVPPKQEIIAVNQEPVIEKVIEKPKEEIKLEEIIKQAVPKEEIKQEEKQKVTKLEKLKVPKPPVMKPTQPQCTALTVKGTQCKYPVQPDQKMCTRHLKVFASAKNVAGIESSKQVEKVQEQKLESEAVKQIIDIVNTEQLPHPSQTESVPL